MLKRLMNTGHRLPDSVKIGQWTEIRRGARIGQRVQLGDWSAVGENSVVGDDCVFGNWAKIGSRVTLGRGVHLGSHTIIQDDVQVPDGFAFQDYDLVTPDGVIPGRTGGSVTSFHDGIVQISGPFGVFLMREEAYDRCLLEDFQNGRSDELEGCRIAAAPETQVEREAMLRELEAARRRASISLVSQKIDPFEPGI